jgi:hypothetical protein
LAQNAGVLARFAWHVRPVGYKVMNKVRSALPPGFVFSRNLSKVSQEESSVQALSGF